MMLKLLSVAALAVIFASAVSAVEIEDHDSMLMDHGDGHLMDMGGGMVMGQNANTLPGGCDSISETKEITVHAGHKYAEKFPGRMFAFDIQEFQFEPCTKLTVHFVNEDNIRHQWMMHGLPKYLYPKGMFHLEVSGPGKVSGTLILPSGDKTYLVHCDIAQHMEKGMKAQLKVGDGDGDLPSIPGVTAMTFADDYKVGLPELLTAAEAAAKLPEVAVVAATPASKVQIQQESDFSGLTVVGLAIGLVLAPFLGRKFAGMTASEVVATVFEWLRFGVDALVSLASRLIKLVTGDKNTILPGN
jgi:hypothetical protein